MVTDENRLDPKAQATPAQGIETTAQSAEQYQLVKAFVVGAGLLNEFDASLRPVGELRRLSAQAMGIEMPDPEMGPPQSMEELQARYFLEEVNARVHRLQVDEAARRRFDQIKALADPQYAPVSTLAEVLALPPEPMHRVEGIIPADASTLIVAMRKTGKTTMILNLAQSLLTGEAFLGKFMTTPVASTSRVAILNYEVSGRQLARWAQDVGLDPGRLVLVNLRGVPNPLANPVARDDLAAELRSFDVESVIVDPFGRAFTGKDQNNAADVGAFLQDLDLFARGEAGAKDLILTTHAGWKGDRSRGSTALEDWPDSIITLSRQEEKDDGPRFLKATGRDVDLDEDQLAYDPRTRRLTLTGNGSKREAAVKSKVIDLGVYVERLVKAAGPKGINTSQIRAELKRLRDNGEIPWGFQDRMPNDACKHLVEQGLIAVADGYKQGLAKVYVSTAKA